MTIYDIINKYGKFIKYQISSYTNDDNIINEIYQDILIKLWQKSPESVNLKFLSKLVRFAFIDNYRRNKKHLNYIPIDKIYSIAEYSDFVITKEDIIETELLLKNLLSKIDNLKESQRDVILLRIAGYNFIQIAKIMNITHNQAIGHMYYAKQNLKKLKVMTVQEALIILTTHQQWRQGADIEMTEPKVITEALDVVLNYAIVSSQADNKTKLVNL